MRKLMKMIPHIRRTCLLFLACISIFACDCFCQTTITIQGQVEDVNGSIYAGGSGVFTLTPQNVQWTTGGTNPVKSPLTIAQLDSFGRFSISITSTAAIDQQPLNPQWTISFCSAQYQNPTTKYCFTMLPIALTTSQDITSIITPQAAILPISGGGGGCSGLTIGEVAFGKTIGGVCGGDPTFTFDDINKILGIGNIDGWVLVDGTSASGHYQTLCAALTANTSGNFPNGISVWDAYQEAAFTSDPFGTCNPAGRPYHVHFATGIWKTSVALFKDTGNGQIVDGDGPDNTIIEATSSFPSNSYIVTQGNATNYEGVQIHDVTIACISSNTGCGGLNLDGDQENDGAFNINAIAYGGNGITISSALGSGTTQNMLPLRNWTAQVVSGSGFPLQIAGTTNGKIEIENGTATGVVSSCPTSCTTAAAIENDSVADVSLRDIHMEEATAGIKDTTTGQVSITHVTGHSSLEDLFVTTAVNANYTAQQLIGGGTTRYVINDTASGCQVSGIQFFSTFGGAPALDKMGGPCGWVDSPFATTTNAFNIQLPAGFTGTNSAFAVLDNLANIQYDFENNGTYCFRGGDSVAALGCFTHGNTVGTTRTYALPDSNMNVSGVNGVPTNGHAAVWSNTSGSPGLLGDPGYAPAAATSGGTGAASIIAGTTIVGGSCASGYSLFNNAGILGCQVGGGITLSTLGTNNILQTSLNFIASNATTIGLTSTPVNPSAGNEAFNITGTLTPNGGGLGVPNPTAHTLPIAEGASNFNFLAMGVDTILQGQGSGTDPAPLSLTNCVGANAYDTSTHTFVCNSLPGNTPFVSHQFLTSYNSGTGVLGQAQPAYSDISGTPTIYNQTFQVGGTPLTQELSDNFIAGTNMTITPSIVSGVTTLTFTASSTASVAFSAITGSTNTSAAMVVGTGGSLAASGSGTIAATTSAALASTPSLCTTGQAPTGILASGNATGCAAFVTNPLTTLGDVIYGGASGALTRLAGPTGPNGVPQTLIDVPATGAAVAETFALAGVPIDAQTGTTYTIAATDRTSLLTTNNAGAIATALPQAGSTSFGSNYPFVTCDSGAGSNTITPTTSTISSWTGSAYVSAATTLALTTGQCAWVFSDNSNYYAIKITGGTGNTTSTSLTTNTLPKANGANSIIDSSVTDDGTTVSTAERFAVGGTGPDLDDTTLTANQNIHIFSGNGTYGSAGTGSVSLAGTSASPLTTVLSTGLLGTYAGVTGSSTTGALDVPYQIGWVSCTQATCASSYTTVVATTATTLYSIHASADCSTSVSLATVAISIKYTDTSSTVQTISPSAAVCTTLGSASVQMVNQEVVALTGTNIQYEVTTANTPTYAARVSIHQEGTN